MKFNESLQECKNEPNDLFFTPPHLAKQLVNIIDQYGHFEHGDIILDPCSGKGAFFHAFGHCLNSSKNSFKFLECEIEKGVDFYEFKQDVDWIISNPPFSDLTKWLNHTMLLNPKGFAYIMPTYSLTYSRLKEIESFGYYVEKTVIIDNPKHWNIGFAMAFYLFTKTGCRSTRLVNKIEPKQSRLDV